jgi:hypothetical protein
MTGAAAVAWATRQQPRAANAPWSRSRLARGRGTSAASFSSSALGAKRMARVRAVVFAHEFRADLMLWALAINLLLMTAVSIAFVLLLDSARRAGTLMSIGE